MTIAADEENVGGFFTLSFEGETTDLIDWDSNAEGDDSVKSKLERLSTVGTVTVARDYSKRVVNRMLVDVVLSAARDHDYATVTQGDIDDLVPGDIIFIGNEEFTVRSLGSTRINLGITSDYLQGANFSSARRDRIFWGDWTIVHTTPSIPLAFHIFDVAMNIMWISTEIF